MTQPLPSETFQPHRTRADLLAFAQQRPLPDGELRRSHRALIRLPGYVHNPRHRPRLGIYDFEWGFVAETITDAGEVFWALHARGLWEATPGPESHALQARIYGAYNELMRTEATQLLDADQSAVTLWTEDPRVYDAALAFCAPCTSCLSVAREWIATRLLGVLWPEALDRVMCPDHVFAREAFPQGSLDGGIFPLLIGSSCQHGAMDTPPPTGSDSAA